MEDMKQKVTGVIEGLCEKIDNLKEENNLLKIERDSALAQQTKVFNEQQEIIKQLQEAVESRNKTISEKDKEIQWLDSNCQAHKNNLYKLLKAQEEISRLQGKVKEAHDWGCTIGIGKEESWEQFSKDNNIKV
jgi:septal ring factor EnvC (AmiA/AmiB activator)